MKKDKYIPGFKEFQIGLYMANLTQWNPEEYEDWELPQIGDVKLYLDLFREG